MRCAASPGRPGLPGIGTDQVAQRGLPMPWPVSAGYLIDFGTFTRIRKGRIPYPYKRFQV
jgi:hypothetical protein